MVRIATIVLAASLAAAAQEKKPVEATPPDTNVAPAQKAEPPPTADKAPVRKNGSKSAKKGAGPPGPKPDPALAAAFGNTVGTWRCTGSMVLPPDMGGQQLKTRSQMTIRREVGGFAYSGDYRMEKNKAFPGLHARMLWTYDPAVKKFYELSADDGGSAVRGESDGMQDGRMVWSEEGTMMGKPAKSTTTILSKGNTLIDMQFSMQVGGSNMTGADRCKKI